jgi:hypothetical protein
MRRTLILALFIALGMSSGVWGQGIVYYRYLQSLPNGTLTLRNDATDAGAAQFSDSTDWIWTNGWDRATIQHIGTDTYALDSVSYTIVARWSNDKTTAFFTDSLALEGTEGSANLDSIIVRPAAYVRFLIWSHVTPNSPRAASNYASVAAILCAKGVK